MFKDNAPDKLRDRTHIYKLGEVMEIYSDEAEQYFSDGWFDSPDGVVGAKFEKEYVTTEKEATEVIELEKPGDKLDAMSVKKLKAYAVEKHPSLQYYKTANKKTMLRLIRAIENDKQAAE